MSSNHAMSGQRCHHSSVHCAQSNNLCKKTLRVSVLTPPKSNAKNKKRPFSPPHPPTHLSTQDLHQNTRSRLLHVTRTNTLPQLDNVDFALETTRFPPWTAMEGQSQIPISSFFPNASDMLSNNRLSCVLTALFCSRCKANECINSETIKTFRTDVYPDGSNSLFHSVHVPSIRLYNYISNFVHKLGVTPSVYIVALVYLDRVAAEDCMLSLTFLNVHRLVTTAISLAIKFVEDDAFSNAFVGRLGGVPSTSEMNLLEVQFLRRLHWNCSVSLTTYIMYAEFVVSIQRSTAAPPAQLPDLYSAHSLAPLTGSNR